MVIGAVANYEHVQVLKTPSEPNTTSAKCYYPEEKRTVGGACALEEKSFILHKSDMKVHD